MGGKLTEQSFSYWMRTNLKDAFSGLIIQDVDFVFISKNSRWFLFIEEKNSEKARTGPAQKIIFQMFDDILSDNIAGYRFLGTHIIKLTEEIPFKQLINEITKSINNRKRHAVERETLEKLWDCKGESRVKKTEQERSFYRDSLISKILSKENINTNAPKGIYIENINWIFLNYCTGYFVFLEESTCNKHLRDEKREFIKIIDEIFEKASTENLKTKRAKNPKSGVVYSYLGYYHIQFSKTDPKNSSSIYINQKRIKINDLISVLNLDNKEIEKYKIDWKCL